MAITNRDRTDKTLGQLREGLTPFIGREPEAHLADAMQEVFQHFTSTVGCKAAIKVEFEAEDPTCFDVSQQSRTRRM